MADLVKKTGDTSPIYGVLLDADGNPVDIQNATVRFLMRRKDSLLTKVAAAASNDQNGDGSDGSTGQVSYDPTALQMGDPGIFLYEWEVTFSGGVIQTYPEGRHLVALLTEGLA